MIHEMYFLKFQVHYCQKKKKNVFFPNIASIIVRERSLKMTPFFMKLRTIMPTHGLGKWQSQALIGDLLYLIVSNCVLHKKDI